MGAESEDPRLAADVIAGYQAVLDAQAPVLEAQQHLLNRQKEQIDAQADLISKLRVLVDALGGGGAATTEG